MVELAREIWFICNECGGESYCGGEFDKLEDPAVMCPYCRNEMKLKEVRVE